MAREFLGPQSIQWMRTAKFSFMLKEYIDVRSWLENFIPYTYSKKNLGLARIRHLLKLFGNPQDKFKSIHIAGTSGKGSTAFYTARLLELSEHSENSENRKVRQSVDQRFRVSDKSENLKHRKSESSEYSGLKVGLHLSPHLVDIRERMQIFAGSQCDPVSENLNETGSSLMPMRRFIRLFNEIKPVVEKIKVSKSRLTPSYFEILVAASFKYFADERVDWTVVEVGLGGRLDATNVLKPEISLITNVGLDHTDILGTTIEKITFEKAGVIKEKTPVVTAAYGKALEVIKKVAKEKKAQLITIDTQLLGVEPLVFKNKRYKYVSIRYIKRSNSNNLPNKTENLDLAGSALSTLGFRFTAETIKKVSKLTFPGRFEGVDDGVILDGAHNADKIQFLIESLSHWPLAISYSKNIKTKGKSRKVKGIILVVAFKKGKNWKKMVDLLVKNLPIRKVIATQFHAPTDTGFFASVDAKEIAKYIQKVYRLQTTVYSNSQQAVFKGLMAKGELANGVLLVTGSLYLVGEARTVWKLPQI